MGKNFGPVVKEGLYEFNDFHDQIFDFSNDKKKIYYISGENKDNLLNSPQMELFKNKKINVLLITDPVDEFWMPMKMKFKDYEFASITKGDVDIEDKKESKKEKEEPKEDIDFVGFLKKISKIKLKM